MLGVKRTQLVVRSDLFPTRKGNSLENPRPEVMVSTNGLGAIGLSMLRWRCGPVWRNIEHSQETPRYQDSMGWVFHWRTLSRPGFLGRLR